MSSYLFDTNHSSMVFRGDLKLSARIAAQATDTFFLCLPSVGELWLMIHKSARIAENETKLRIFLATRTQLPFDPPAAEIFGQTTAHLRRLGRPIPDIDLQIASIALARNLTVLTADAHFDNIPNLKHENWL